MSEAKLNWKVIAASKGYKSLKAAYVQDVQDVQKQIRLGRTPHRTKKTFRRHFTQAIGFAMKYSNKWGIPIEKVLLHWETVRGYQWWLNFYQDRWLSHNKPNQEGNL